MTPSPAHVSARAAWLCLLGVLASGPLLAQEPAEEAPAPEPASAAAEEGAEAAAPALTLESVTVRGPVEGRPLAADTLARLSVRLGNRGSEFASAFAFTVKVGGQELPVYQSQVFLQPVPAGETIELPLYNFWTSETGRPAPADGKLSVEVTLREARWARRSEEGEVEVWSLGDAVPGLPVTAATVVELKAPDA